MIFKVLDSGKNLDSSEGDPLRVQCHLVGEGSSQLIK